MQLEMWKGYRGRCLTSNQILESEASSPLISESPLLLLLATNSSEYPPAVSGVSVPFSSPAHTH